MFRNKSRPVSRNIKAITIVAAALCSIAPCHAARLANFALTLKTEYSNAKNYMSPGGGPQPVTWISGCAVPSEGADAQPGQTVLFDFINATGTWQLSANSAVSNSNGQAIVQARPTYGAAQATLRARWTTRTNQTMVATQTLYAIGDSCQTLNASPQQSWGGGFANRYAIRWTSLNSVFNSEIAAALASWQNTGHVGFSSSASNPEITFADQTWSTDLIYAVTRTTDVGTYRIDLNKYYMDGNPTDPFASPFPPRTACHHIQGTVAHELGHALRIGHNDYDRVALMWFDIDNYFVCGTSEPTADETVTLFQLYP